VQNPAGVKLELHSRATYPLATLLVVLLGVPFLLSRERNLWASVGLAVLTVLAFYGVLYLCRYVAHPPVLAAWLPILLFGPVAAVALDSVKT